MNNSRTLPLGPPKIPPLMEKVLQLFCAAHRTIRHFAHGWVDQKTQNLNGSQFSGDCVGHSFQ